MPTKGVQAVKTNLRASLERIAGEKTHAGLYAILSQGATLAATMTPVDTSNLINSQYAPQIERRGTKTIGRVGYTASYAAAVHSAPGTLMGQDRPGGNGKFWDPSGEPGFLDKGFEELKPSIPAILKAVYRV